jgi:hypothetical protein
MNTLDTRDALRQLLPWHENGTLNDIERERVRALLATDLEANRQRRELHAIREALVDESTLASDMGSNLQRLRAQMGPTNAIAYMPMTARWLAIAASAIVSLGAVTFYAGTRVGPYQTLTATAAPEPVAADADLVRVDVAAGVDAAALMQLTGDAQVRVLSGPSEHGVATLACAACPRSTDHRAPQRRSAPAFRRTGPTLSLEP